MLTNTDSVRTTLISGDSEICKALLFELAISWSKEGNYVYYFAPTQIDTLPLSFHERTEPSADALKLITFIYTPTYDELVGQLVRLPTFQRPASIILIDDLDNFSNDRDNGAIIKSSRCCACILNSALACYNATERPINVCATSYESVPVSIVNVYRMYFVKEWKVKVEPGDEETDEARRIWIKDADNKRALEYCRLDDAALVLRGVYAEDDGSADANQG